MSKVKDLKNDPQNSLDIIELLGSIFPVDKTKYLETILRIVNNDPDLDTTIQRYVKEMASNGVSTSYLKSLTKLQAFLAGALIIEFITPDNIRAFTSFCEYNERSLIEENDVSKYKTFKQIAKAVEIADEKLAEKRYEKQVKLVYEDDTWKILRPLTHQSSLKYGASTKWCTAMNEQPDYFERYSKGILIYTINKKTGFKVATHLDLENQELTFWNALDKRVDSMASRLPTQILEIIKNELDVNGSSNMTIAKAMIREEKKVTKDWKSVPLVKEKWEEKVRSAVTKVSNEIFPPNTDPDPNPPLFGESQTSVYNEAVKTAKTKMSFMDMLKEDLNKRTPNVARREIEGDFSESMSSGHDSSGPEGIAGVGGDISEDDLIRLLTSTKKKVLNPDITDSMYPIGSIVGMDTSQLTDSDTSLSAVVRYDTDGRAVGVETTESYKSYLEDIKNEDLIEDMLGREEPPINTVSYSRTSPDDVKVFTSGKAPVYINTTKNKENTENLRGYIAGVDPAFDDIQKIREKTVDFDDLPEGFDDRPF